MCTNTPPSRLATCTSSSHKPSTRRALARVDLRGQGYCETTSRSIRGVVLVLAVVVAALATHPAYAQRTKQQEVERLNRSLGAAIADGNYEKAITRGQELVELLPDAPAPPYNLACAYALLGDTAKSVMWLKIAAQKGFSFTATVTRDNDLDEIRADPGYAEAFAMIQKNNAAELDELKPKIGRMPLVMHLPPGYDGSKPVPLIVALHPYGGRAKPIADIWKKIAADVGAIVVAPQSHMRQGQGFTWGVVEHAEYTILKAIERTEAKYNVDAKRVVLAGFSQGSSMSFYVGLKHPDRIAGVIPVSGFYDERLTPIPPKVPDVFPRFFIMNGALDDLVHNNRAAAFALKAAGAGVEIRIYDGIGHAFPNNRDSELREAIRFVLR